MNFKSFFLSSIGNKTYNKYVYFLIKNITCLFVFIFTISPKLTNLFWRNFKDERLKNSLRIFNWLLNFSFIRRLKINDITFDISNKLSLNDLLYLSNKLFLNKKNLSFDLNFDLLYVNARIVSNFAERGDQKQFNKYLNNFSFIFNKSIKSLQPQSSSNKNFFFKSSQAPIFLNEALKDFSNVLKNKNVFLAFGTLLGFIREGKILDHDLDLDVGYLYKDKKQFDGFLGELKKTNNFKILVNDAIDLYELKNNHIQFRKLPSIITLANQNGAHIDIFICHKVKNKIFFYAKHFCWEVSFFRTKKVKIIDNLIANIPFNSNKYLAENYGDWKTPVIDYNFMRDSKNLGFTRNTSSVVAYTKSVFLNLKTTKEVIKHLEHKKILKNNLFNKELFLS